MPGLAAATALARQGLAVAIADGATIRATEVDDGNWDTRVYAVSPGSATFLADIGTWPLLPVARVSAIEAMHVTGDAGGHLSFSAYELGERALAWMVEERALRTALLAAAYAAGVQVLAPAAFARLENGSDRATLHFADGACVHARLVVAADGLRSWLRRAAGIAAEPAPYAQSAVVAHFAIERAHRGIARQWFLGNEGVLAWLPLPGAAISIVWSAPTALAAELLALEPAALASRVAAAGGHAQGLLTLMGAPATFPLAYLRVPSVVAPRLALIGDAAHGVHPLAGQGLNLGFGDAAVLARVLAARGPVDDAGSALLLERYARLRAEPVLAMQTVTDGLTRLFGVDRRWLARLRNGGMATVERFPGLKRALAQPALR